MARQDYYETLGVERNADDAALKSAYRKLALRFHPDRNPDDAAAEQRFKDINEAYDILKDPQKRAAYDRFGHDAFDGGMGAGPAGAGFAGAGFADIFDEVFGDFMGGRRGGSANQRGADLRFDMSITLEEAFRGRKANVSVPAASPARPVRAAARSRFAPGHLRHLSRTRPGAGATGFLHRRAHLRHLWRRGDGDRESVRGLPRQWSGQEKPVAVGHHSGRRGGRDAHQAVGRGRGRRAGAAPGDLYIFLSIDEHPFFRRDGSTVFCEVPVSMTTAALGGAIEVPTLDGPPVRVTIAPGTQTGTRYRLRGKGMSQLRSSVRGDFHVDVVVETPVNLTQHQKQLLEEFSPRPEQVDQPEVGRVLRPLEVDLGRPARLNGTPRPAQSRSRPSSFEV